MIKQSTNQPIRKFHENLEYIFEYIDSVDLIRTKKCTEVHVQQSEFDIGCQTCSLTYSKNLKNYLKNKLEDLKLQPIDVESDFKKPCFNCSYSFHGSSYKDGHFNLQKISEVAQKCDNCERNFTMERSFYHNCNICNASFQNCKLLFNHRTSEHNSEKPYQCAACHKSVSHGGIYNHIYKHTRPHICPYCNTGFAIKYNLKLHMLSHTGEKPYTCKYCSKKFSIKHSLNIHLIEHNGGRQFKCDECHKTFATQKLLNQHNSIHLERIFQGKYCPKQVTQIYNLNHTHEHTGTTSKFKCEFCDKTFDRKCSLNRHKPIHLEQTIRKKLKCDVCDKTFAKKNLKEHKRIHMEKKFQCIYCLKKFRTKYYLNLHLFVHTGDKKFKCNVCANTFALQSGLNRHKLLHMREPIEKSFKCTYCPNQYNSKDARDIHLIDHTGHKKFTCNICDRTFAHKGWLYRHKLTHRKILKIFIEN